MKYRHKKSTFSTELGKLYNEDCYKEHIEVTRKYWFCFPGNSDVYKITNINWHKITITYIRSGVVFYTVDDHPDVGERSFSIDSYMATALEYAELDPIEDLDFVPNQEYNFRFDDKRTKIINWDNSEYMYIDDGNNDNMICVEIPVLEVIEHVIGRGTIIVINNKDRFPINLKESYIKADKYDKESIKIRGIERMSNLMEPPKPLATQGIVVSTDDYEKVKDIKTVYVYSKEKSEYMLK